MNKTNNLKITVKIQQFKKKYLCIRSFKIGKINIKSKKLSNILTSQTLNYCEHVHK